MTRILVVEDDDAIRRLAHDLLSDEGYEVYTADSGPEGLDTLDATQPDLVVLDLMMPLMDGVSFAREMERRHRQVPIIVLSGSHDLEQHAQDMGAAGAVLKPFDIDDFLGVVRRALPPAPPPASPSAPPPA